MHIRKLTKLLQSLISLFLYNITLENKLKLQKVFEKNESHSVQSTT